MSQATVYVLDSKLIDESRFWLITKKQRDDKGLDEWVVTPNHRHGMIVITSNGFVAVLYS